MLDRLDEGADAIVSQVSGVDSRPAAEPAVVADGARDPIWLADGRLLVDAGGELLTSSTSTPAATDRSPRRPAGAQCGIADAGRALAGLRGRRPGARRARPRVRTRCRVRYKVDGVGIVPDRTPSHIWRIDLDGGRLTRS